MFTAWPPPGMPGKSPAIATPAPEADGCDVARPGKPTHEIARQLVDDIVLVSEDDITSMVALIQRNKVITEGAGR